MDWETDKEKIVRSSSPLTKHGDMMHTVGKSLVNRQTNETTQLS